jgi:hydroxyethylthiazole kinase-like uncharacterized protein yjeF
MTNSNQDTTIFSMDEAHWKALEKSGDRHKYFYGHAVVVSGEAGQGGAARLAARGALRIGAGLVSVICSADQILEHASHLNAVMIKSFGGKIPFLDKLKDIKPSAICVGPNLGLDETARIKLLQVLSFNTPLCIDADAITLLSSEPQNSRRILHPHTVMTPHEGELRRYIPEVLSQTTDRIVLATAAAEKAGCVVLFKGPETIVAAPNGRCEVVSSLNFQSAGWLATAGSGDVLAGFITGLLARGFDGFDAATIGANLHFRCAEMFGPGLIAEDIPEMLPKLLLRRRKLFQ